MLVIFAAAVCARAQNSYSVHNLVSDLPGYAEQLDANLKNPWGLASSGTSPFWISDNHTGVTTVYNGDGKPFPEASPLRVTIPAAAGGNGGASSPTGQTFNDTPGFELAPGKPATFLFASEDGTISGWSSAAGSSAMTLVDNSGSGAVYKGVAVASTSNGPVLYAANFSAGTVDAFDAAFRPVQIPDEMRGPIMAGYAPFNIQRIGQRLYVTYAMQDGDKHD